MQRPHAVHDRLSETEGFQWLDSNCNQWHNLYGDDTALAVGARIRTLTERGIYSVQRTSNMLSFAGSAKF